MAVTGSGTSSDPYIVHDWAEFEATNTSTNSTKYMRFADIHVENGEFDISGTGTSADPYVVSTYGEMLHVTGASNIHLCKCINNDLPNGERLYRYDEEDPETHEVTSTYCRYNPAPSTIDYNDISMTARSGIPIWMHTDFNGWTLRNFKISMPANTSKEAVLYTGSGSVANADVKNLIFLNVQGTTSSDANTGIFFVHIYDSIIQMDINASSISSAHLGLGIDYSSISFSRNSMSLKIIGANCQLCGQSDQAAYSQSIFSISDSNVDIDIDIAKYGSNRPVQLRLSRSILKGKYKYSANGTYTLLGACTDSIYDVEHISTVAPAAPYNNGTRCLFNNDVKESPAIQTGWSKTGWTGVTSTQLLSPSELQSEGFPIGVDNSE